MIKSGSFKRQLIDGMEEMDGEWRRTCSSGGILCFNLKGEKLTFKFCFCFIKRQIPPVFDLKEEICQCPWLFLGDIAILGHFTGWAGSAVCPQFRCLFFHAVLSTSDRDADTHLQGPLISV